MKPRYDWNTIPEVWRFVLITIAMYLVQILPTIVDDVTTAPNPWKFAISLIVAGLQFVLARLMAWYDEKKVNPRPRSSSD